MRRLCACGLIFDAVGTELNRGAAELALLQAEAVTLQAAIDSGDDAIVEEALRVQESCPSRVEKV